MLFHNNKNNNNNNNVLISIPPRVVTSEAVEGQVMLLHISKSHIKKVSLKPQQVRTGK